MTGVPDLMSGVPDIGGASPHKVEHENCELRLSPQRAPWLEDLVGRSEDLGQLLAEWLRCTGGTPEDPTGATTKSTFCFKIGVADLVHKTSEHGLQLACRDAGVHIPPSIVGDPWLNT